MSIENEVRKSAWLKEVDSLERDVMRTCPSLVGGKLSKESVEDYANRGMRQLQDALARLAVARLELAALPPAPKAE